MRMHGGRLYVQPEVYDTLRRTDLTRETLRLQVLGVPLAAPSAEQLQANLPGLSADDAVELAAAFLSGGGVDVVVGDVPVDQ